MSQDDLAERLDAVERRLDAAYPEPRGTDAELVERVDSFADRLADLEAAVEAVEGYVGEIERVDEELEQRADAALATADGLEERIDGLDERVASIEVDDRRPAGDVGGGSSDTYPSDPLAGEIGPETVGMYSESADRAPSRCTCSEDEVASERLDAGGGAATGTRSQIGHPQEDDPHELDSPAASARDPREDPTRHRTGDGEPRGDQSPGSADRVTAAAGQAGSRTGPAPRPGCSEAVGTDGGLTPSDRTVDTAVSDWSRSPVDDTGEGTTSERRDPIEDTAQRRSWEDEHGETLLDRLRALL